MSVLFTGADKSTFARRPCGSKRENPISVPPAAESKEVAIKAIGNRARSGRLYANILDRIESKMLLVDATNENMSMNAALKLSRARK